MNVQLEEINLEIKKLKPKFESLAEALKLEESTQKLKSLEEKTAQPNFWNDQEKSQKILSEISLLTAKIKEYKKLRSEFDDLEVLAQLSCEEGDDSSIAELENQFKKIKGELENQTLSTLLTGEYDSQNAIITFHAGAGGTEAQDWVEMLCRMYARWGEKHKYKVKMLDCLDGEFTS